MFDSLEV